MPRQGADSARSGILLAKWRLVCRASREPKLGLAGVAVLMTVCDHFWQGDKDVGLGLDALATEAEIARSSVVRAVKKLVEYGFLDVTAGGGRGRWTRYRPRLEIDAPALQIIGAGEAATDAPTQQIEPVNCSADAQKTVAPTRPVFLPKTPTEKTERQAPPGDDPEFAEFWGQYPNRKAKGAALKAFKAARRKADLVTIMAGVARYAAEVERTERKFIKHPATWLNAECWEDAWTPPATEKRGIAEIVLDVLAPRGAP